MSRTIIIGTRGSELALWQAHYTKDLLEKQGHTVELKIISTHGDRTQQWNTSFEKLEGKGFFTKELEEELLAGTIDLAVHSHKDLPTTNPDGLIVAGVSDREDPSELLLIRQEAVNEKRRFSLKDKAIVGTSSARRKSQLLSFRPDVELQDLRGNVPTRIRKLREGQYDAILLAAAGVERLALDLEDLHVEKLNPREFVPAPAQGVLAWQIRENDAKLQDIIDTINNIDVQVSIAIERRILNLFDGGCQLPLGAYCESEVGEDERPKFKVWTSVADAWDQQPKYQYFESYHTEELAEHIVEKIRHVKPAKVFITRTLRENDYLGRSLRALGFSIQGQSLIEFKLIPIVRLPACDWIFFSSKHAVKYFFQQNPQTGKVKYGCVGKSTADELRQCGHRADFIGQGTDTKLIGKQFASVVGSGKVIFPSAKGSLQSIPGQMVKKDHAIVIPVYETIKHSAAIPTDTDILVFTSPSNVEAFFEKNKVNPQQRIVAMGDATEHALQKKGVRKSLKPAAFDELALLQAVLTQSSGE